MGDSFLKNIHGIIQLSIKNKIILERWKKTVTTLLEKKEGKPFIHKFRAIHIVEGDLQFVARYFYAYKMMKYAEDNNLISDAQYGGRKKTYGSIRGFK